MPGPGSRPPRGAGPKPKNIKKTLLRVMSYLTKSWLPLLFVLGCLLISVGANLGGTYYMRPVINNLTTGYATQETNQGGSYVWNETAVKSHTETENEDGTYTARYEEDGVEYTATVEEKQIEWGESDAWRIALIVILSVVAVLIIGGYVFLLPRRNKKQTK